MRIIMCYLTAIDVPKNFGKTNSYYFKKIIILENIYKTIKNYVSIYKYIYFKITENA